MDAKERDVINNAAKLLHILVTNKKHRMAVAASKRKILSKALETGMQVNDHRLDFIADASSDIFGWLGDRAAEYDAKYPFDVCLVADLADILNNALRKLKAKVSELDDPGLFED